ncbi:MAG: HAMP domain-containing histidine kinase, partial [Elusimicrobiaceae bacterium]|nr:HAMP domain-containing histidine kinase [Elusimicrobiaceae bacterium]
FTNKALDEINIQGRHLAELVRKLSAFNKVMESSPKSLEKKSIGLKELLKDCASQAVLQEKNGAGLETTASEKTMVKRGTFIDIDCPSNLSLNANEEMVRLGIEELLSNAIKFNNKMEKNIKVQAANHGDSISISVRDYGVGIRPQDVNRIFEPFFQVDDNFTGQISGLGLGLPMVQRIAQLHGGSASVVSDRGLGSIFTIKFTR